MSNAGGILSIVGTPIGNLEDITLRALRVLRECDVILCEDTRVTQSLLKKYEINTPTIQAGLRVSQGQLQKIKESLLEGKHLAFVSDAGTPGFSDPGTFLVDWIREQKIPCRIEPIPGASAVASLISIAGVLGNEWSFLGFLPQKKGRQTMLKKVTTDAQASIFFESSHRIMKCLQELVVCASDRKIGVARELTKIYEEYQVGTAQEILHFFETHPEKQRGEFVILVYPQ